MAIFFLLSFLLLNFFNLDALAAETAPPTFINDQQIQVLAHDPEWLALGHYKRGFLGWKSEANGAGFFMTPAGRRDPESELRATLDGIRTPAGAFADNEHPQCRFPARTIWLKQKLNLTNLTQVKCPMLERYEKSLDAESAHLVFSSYYLNSPASAFGHTFLRINKRALERQGDRVELLDSGLGYAANVTTDNPILYAFFGLAGFFDGVFTKVPYYYKVREYNDYESRDLWSYALNLRPDELQMLIAHIWEVDSADFTYYYLTRNCSYYLVEIFDVAAPRLHLQDHLPFWIIPSDTVQALAEVPGLMGDVTYRPSARSLFHQRVEKLSPRARENLKALLRTKNPASVDSSLSIHDRAAVFDSAIDFLDSRHSHEVMRADSPFAQEKQVYLGERAQLHIHSDPLDLSPPESERPDKGHGSARFGVLGGYQRDVGGYMELTQRFAHHDPLDPSVGYPPNSQIEFMNLEFRVREQSAVFDRGDLIRVLNLNPWWSFEHGPSWKMDLGVRRQRDQSCDACHAMFLTGGGGIAGELTHLPQLLPYLFLDLDVAYATPIQPSRAQLNLGPEAGFYLHLSPLLRSQWGAMYAHSFFSKQDDDFDVFGEIRWSFARNWALNARDDHRKTSQEATLGLYHYY